MAGGGDPMTDIFSLIQRGPSLPTWASLCARLDEGAALPPGGWQQLDEALASFPEKLRIAPEAWLRAAAAGAPPPSFALVRTVCLHGLERDTIAALLDRRAMAVVRHLVADGCDLGDEGCLRIAESRSAPSLASLSLARVGLGPAGAAELCRAARLSGLVELSLADNQLDDLNLKLFLLSPHLKRLVSLSLAENGITDAGAIAFGASSESSRFRWLDLAGNDIGENGTRALLSSAHLSGSGRLDLRGNPGIEAAGLEARAEEEAEARPEIAGEIADVPRGIKAFVDLGRRLPSGREQTPKHRWPRPREVFLCDIPASALEASIRWVSPDGTIAIAGDKGDSLLVYDLRAGAVTARLGPLEDWVAAVAATPDARLILSAGGDSFTERIVPPAAYSRACWDDDDYWPSNSPSESKEQVYGPRDYRIWVWDRDTGACIRRIEGHKCKVVGLGLSGNGSIVVSLDHGGDVHARRVSDGRLLGWWSIPRASAVAVDGRGRFALVGAETGKLFLLDVEARKLDRFVPKGPADEAVISVASSPDGRFAAALDMYAIRLWDVEKRAFLGMLYRRDLALHQLVATHGKLEMLIAKGARLEALSFEVD
jgi:hypothetical protein